MERRKNPGGSNPSSIGRTWSEHTGRRPHSDLVRTYLVFGTVYAVQCQTVETGTEGNSNDLPYHQQRNIGRRCHARSLEQKDCGQSAIIDAVKARIGGVNGASRKDD